MNAKSIEMPNGMRYRISSTKRYLVVVYLGGEARWRADYRTDVESRALARWREESRRGTVAHVIDARRPEVLR